MIGPAPGRDRGREERTAAAEALRTALAARPRLAGQALRPDWRAGRETLGYRFSLEASFLAEGGERALALVLRDEPLRQVIETRAWGSRASRTPPISRAP